MSLLHPHHRRLPRHARHLVKQLLKPRVAMRAAVLQRHAVQLDSAVNLRENPDRLHPDHDRHVPGVRVVVGPESRSLLKQLLDSRDIRVQQELVREIIHQFQKRMYAAAKRAARLETARRVAGRTASRIRRSRLWPWLRSLPSLVKALVTGRTTRTVGNRTTTRTRRSTTTRTRAAVGDGRATRTKKPAPERASRATRT